MSMRRLPHRFIPFSSFVLFCLLLHTASAFVTRAPRVSTAPLSAHANSANQDDDDAPILRISGNNLPLTPALVDYCHKRIGTALSKLAARECDIVLSVHKNPKIKNGHRVEVLTRFSDSGPTIVCHDASPDMYASVDACAAALSRKLRQYKERRRAFARGDEDDLWLPPDDDDDENMEMTDRTEEEDPWADPEQPRIMPVHSFQLDKPISVEEAVFALDYVDHDFYVFRNEATGEINVVYRRHTGGVGLVAP